MRLYLLVFLIILSNSIVNGQAKTDSVKDNQTDSAKIVLLNGQALKYITLEPDSGIYFGELALKIGYKTKHYEHLNEAHRVVGWCYYNQNNFQMAKFHLQYALNDSSLNIFERNNIYKALVIASEKTSDYLHAYLFLNSSTQLKDSLNQQKQNAALLQFQKQLAEKQQDGKEELLRKEKIWQMTKTRQQQLLVIAAIVVAVLVLLAIILFFQLYRHKKYFNEVLEEKNISITETNDQNRKLQNELAQFERLKGEIAKRRENRIQKITVEEEQEAKPEEKKEQLSIVDQYQTASEEERKKMLPKLESFVTIIPTQFQVIEQAFARHDWEMINNTLQTMKSMVHAAGLNQSVILIDEINEHVNANATNRAVVKLLQVKSVCAKTVSAIKNILEEPR